MLSILTSILLLFSPKPDFCSCLPLGPIDDQQYNSYSLIFKGKALKDSVVGYERFITFSVEKYYKGAGSSQTLIVSTASESAMCGINPQGGDDWLIFAYGDSNKYTVSLCSRSKNINHKSLEYNKQVIKDDLKFLERKVKSEKI